MTAENGTPPELQALTDLLNGNAPLPRYELRCGPGVIWWLRLWLADAQAGVPFSSLTGVPMTDDPDLACGEWKIFRDGEVAASGRMEIPEFAAKPFEISFSAFRVADRMDWRYGHMASLPRPSLLPGISSLA